MYFNTNAGLKPLVVSDEILHEALDVMSGEAEYTCCRLGHPNCDPCDREALMLPMLGLYADVYKERDGKHGAAYALIEPLKHRLFPETFEYVHKGLDGVETTTTQVLFGDLVAAVEETIDKDDDDDESARTKGFKPGTNAQRHRFYRHGSSDVSSRFADLTSMVRESFRTSFRRVNVVSEADSEKASPAAAQPAARPQLSWRASAPEYGTFES